MEADTNSSGLNDNSESGECDSLRSDGAIDVNSNNSNTLDYDSNMAKPSSRLERTNIDALDDSARDTLIVPPHDDSSHSGKSSKKGSLGEMRKEEQEILDFGDNEDDEEDGALSDDDEEEGENEPNRIGDEEEGEIDEEENKNPDLDETGEVSDDEGELRTVSNKMTKNLILLKDNKDDGEEDDNELEEGEVSDDDDRAKDPKPICRFFGKGQCTWGSNCRFLHPGVTDKGLYTMFDSMRPIAPGIQPPPSISPGGSKPGLLGVAPPSFTPLIKPDEPLIIESSWERGLRHAKEIIKQSVKRKETDVDFEEKKMNLSLAQEDIDKENDFYMRKPGSPLERKANNSGDEEEFQDFVRERDEARERGRDWNPPRPSHHTPATLTGEIDPDFVRERVHRIKPSRVREAPPRDPHPPMREAPPLHEPEVRMVRESALRRGYNPPPPFSSHGHSSRRSNYDDPRKAEEWHDPWVRTKSPGSHGRKASSLSKRSSYSSGSSRSSSFSSDSSKSSKSSRSSSKSSKSSRGSKSPSKNKTRKKKEREPEVIRKAPPRRVSPKPMRIAPPPPPKEEFGRRGDQRDHHYERSERPMRYAPPAPKESNYPRDRDIRIEKDPYMRNRNMDVKRGRGRGTGRNQRSRNSWSGRSASRSSRSRSNSRSTWSQSPSKSRSRSPGGKTSKVKTKFSRDKSRSRSRSFRKASSSRSHSRSSTSSSTSSRSYSRGGKRKRKVSNKDGREPSVEIEGPPEKFTKIEPIQAKPSKLQEKTIKAEASKSQIKMTLKPSTGFKANKNVLERLSDEFIAADKDSENSSNKILSPKLDDNSKDEFSNDEVEELSEKPSSPKDSKNSRIRREELLKQLKAVEEAIAKKRSKLEK